MLPPARIVIAGYGLLSPLGQSAWETFSALLAGRTIADRCRDLPLDIAPVDLVRAVGAVKLAQHSAADATVELAERAAREAAAMAGCNMQGVDTFIGTSKGAVGAMAGGNGTRPRQVQAVTLGPCGYLSHHLRQRLRLGSTRHFVAACASSLTALHHARQHLLRGLGSSALVLTAEAALHALFIHSYRRLGVLADATPQGYRQRPLDEARRGFMLSEFGAGVLLRRLEDGERPRHGELELVATATATEANDLIRPSADMPGLRRVAGEVFRQSPGIDVLHPHAPGTTDHDAAELEALAGAWPGGSWPDLYACKGALGHGLGAAGLVSLVLACLCLTAGQRPPMPWLTRPLPWPPPPSPAAKEGRGEGSASGAARSQERTRLRDPHPSPLPQRERGPELAGARACARTGAHAVFAAGFGSHVAGAVVRRW